MRLDGEPLDQLVVAREHSDHEHPRPHLAQCAVIGPAAAAEAHPAAVDGQGWYDDQVRCRQSLGIGGAEGFAGAAQPRAAPRSTRGQGDPGKAAVGEQARQQDAPAAPLQVEVRLARQGEIASHRGDSHQQRGEVASGAAGVAPWCRLASREHLGSQGSFGLPDRLHVTTANLGMTAPGGGLRMGR